MKCITKGLICGKILTIFMPQLQITAETMARMKEIVGIKQVHDGDFMVNEMINILEKKIRDRS